ncbi:MAG: polyribonucleotide nucleotidyltransferase [Candidatus Dojkabacteria bacterium]|nr:MAG: polyribonucleotide nucleotidyltransferase [Candidatus Dojkabacteria bacterium]
MYNQKFVYEFVLDGVPFRIESGEFGLLSHVAFLISYGNTSVYITINVGKHSSELDFLPLTIEYSEKLYAGGIISSSPYIKREGKPTESEILKGRLLDHAIRSLFDDRFKIETQIIVQVFAYDKVNDPLYAALVGLSFALMYSGLPFLGPYGATKVGYIDGQIVLNPNLEQMNASLLEMFVSSVEKGVVSIEADANDLSDNIIKNAIERAVQHNRLLIEEQYNFINKYGRKNFAFVQDEQKESLLNQLHQEILQVSQSDIEDALYLETKAARTKAIEDIKFSLLVKYKDQIENGVYREDDISQTLEKIFKKTFRSNLLRFGRRFDNRKLDEVRPLSMRVGVLPGVHGSALFTRGETQSLSIVTLGTDRDELMFQGLEGDSSKRYFHHYNMPGYANGEIDRKFGMPNRRAIGHGAIGEKALDPVLPSEDEFPYTIRVVSEILTSNGSTSMAATCASSLALMDAGVPIKKAIGGVGLGLVLEEDTGEYRILTDIMGMEDFYGDMDFKIAGSRDGITAIQLDNKKAGIPLEIILESIDRSKLARLFILDEMEKCLASPRAHLSHNAPRVRIIKISPDKIGELIGSGGKTIKSIIEKNNVEISIEEDGLVKIYSSNEQSCNNAVTMIYGVLQDLEPGMEMDARIVRIENYGAFVEILNTKIQGLIHISNLGLKRTESIRDNFKVGQVVLVKFLGCDEKGRNKFALAK